VLRGDLDPIVDEPRGGTVIPKYEGAIGKYDFRRSRRRPDGVAKSPASLELDMAYLDQSLFDGTSAGGSALIRSDEKDLPLAHKVAIAVARHDGFSSLRQPGRLSRLLSLVFRGERTNPALANPELEAIRRAAVYAWHGRASLPEAEHAVFAAAGYTDEIYSRIRSLTVV
jgi:hypothetical protein